jgi:hypothetical protein
MISSFSLLRLRSYIIDRYDDLPDYIVFIHGLRYQWHNDDPIYGTNCPPEAASPTSSTKGDADLPFPMQI